MTLKLPLSRASALPRNALIVTIMLALAACQTGPSTVDAATSSLEQGDAAALGFDPAMVFVAHPIQDRSDDELRALADAALPGILARLVAAPTAG